MTFAALIKILEKQRQLHTSLYQLAVEKVEIIKNGDIHALNQMLKDEQSHAAAITMMEKERLKAIAVIFPNSSQHRTIRDCIALAEGEEKIKLIELHQELVSILENTKKQNDLNEQLIYQSLKFVNFSLNLLRPKQGAGTYAPPYGKQQQRPANGSTSVFNSQA
ncbi:flagellar protein FlgN [Caldibacillus lycopersici]|uniref:Flagellar protein FlgN n=1 Tax=Perspicuibacillus lycopersici TaxID=1325689 RepID=A0AAE3LMJ0_9BACI|nr:flagellar protein FlgN [Perspicuibacillus lycopersici]MCU9612986.1 flagellar protein FlgN [Perspicuibacillus lycopersici]